MIKKLVALAALFTLAAPADPVPLVEQKPPAESTKPPKKKKEDPPQAPKKDEKKALPKAPGKNKKPAPAEKPTQKPAEKAAPDQATKAPQPHHSKGPAHEAQIEEAEIEEAKKLQANLAVLNALEEEKQKHATSALRGEIARLKLEKELLTEKLSLAAMKQAGGDFDSLAQYEAEKDRLTREATLAKLEAEQLAAKLKSLQTSSSIETTELMAEVSAIEAAEKRADYANAQPQYLDNPLKKDGTLVVSDRRIPFNGPVTSTLADRVTTRINYFNNKDPKKPIFLVIDDSPGGSVMAGYRILKAMEGSEAPVYVVVKSFAASMAATITTLAEKSFVYPNAIILHHQISQTFGFASMNLTEQKENVEDLKKWWARLADPIAEKMGITSDEFIEMMYRKTVSGDWTEFGDDAVKLKWADHVVNRVHETSLLKNPDAQQSPVVTTTRSAAIENGLTPAVDENGTPYMILPRRNPKDVYMMHNPDGFYRFK